MSLRVPGVCWGLLLLSGAACAEEDFHASVGPGIYSGPFFPGAARARRLVFPFIDAEYAGRLYTSATDLIGVYAYKTTDTQVGAAVEYDLTERLPDVKETERFKLFGSQTVGAVTGDVNVAKDIGGYGEGILGQSNLWLTIPFGPTFSVSTGPGTTWGDSRYMHTLYMGRAGMTDVHINGLAEWVIHSKYRLGAQTWFGYLRGDAAASPLVVRHEQTTVVGWIAYRFN